MSLLEQELQRLRDQKYAAQVRTVEEIKNSFPDWFWEEVSAVQTVPTELSVQFVYKTHLVTLKNHGVNGYSVQVDIWAGVGFEKLSYVNCPPLVRGKYSLQDLYPRTMDVLSEITEAE